MESILFQNHLIPADLQAQINILLVAAENQARANQHSVSIRYYEKIQSILENNEGSVNLEKRFLNLKVLRKRKSKNSTRDHESNIDLENDYFMEITAEMWNLIEFRIEMLNRVYFCKLKMHKYNELVSLCENLVNLCQLWSDCIIGSKTNTTLDETEAKSRLNNANLNNCVHTNIFNISRLKPLEALDKSLGYLLEQLSNQGQNIRSFNGPSRTGLLAQRKEKVLDLISKLKEFTNI
ncbi:hypothetical protein BB559_006957 [Furculomyces boomerangus]|uniref:Uncharacterized protein n=1 Tax=Furculomyces boomerangus TaxID=61424 RepID=A0A2T9XZM1_9FUNG|nr:hypothetical protein BB559_006957 [Furculomyces boomerangus]